MNNFKLYFCFTILFVGSSGCFAQITNDKLRSIKIFGELSGYIRYFHPSDESTDLNWNAFISYGIKKVKNIQNNDSLILVLDNLFQPIAPTVELSSNKIPNLPPVTSPPNTHNYKPIFWQHIGVRGTISSDTYRSKRTNRIEKNFVYYPVQGNLFNAELGVNDRINKMVGDNLFCDIPLCLFGDSAHTYPVADYILLNNLQQELNSINLNDTNSVDNTIACILIIDNVIKHFYPYRAKLINWNQEVNKALNACLKKISYQEQILNLKLLLSTLSDGHSNIWSSQQNLSYFPEIGLICIDNRIFVDGVLNEKYKQILANGDEVISINNEDTETHLKFIKQITNGSTRYQNYFSAITILKGKENSILNLVVLHEGKMIKIDLPRVLPYKSFLQKKDRNDSFRKVSKNVLYLNFSKISEKTLDSILLQKFQFSSIICDLRGYPNGNHGILSHMLNKPDTCYHWFQIPQLIYPDYRSPGYQTSGWKLPSLEPKVKSKLFFLIDNSVISYGESFIAIVKQYKLGTIVGDTTAGTNGNLNSYQLPLNLTFSWTGMKVVTPSGNAFDLLGFSPDVLVTYSKEGIKNNIDEILEKALILAK